MHDAGHLPYTKFMLHDVEEEENFLSFTRARNWLLHSDSSTELLALH
jgi:hypothetical protein